MRIWERAPTDVLCGLCGATVRRSDPVQRVSLLGLKRPLWRCPGCATGDPCPDLPVPIERYRTTTPMVHVAKLIPVVDFKAKAAGE